MFCVGVMDHFCLFFVMGLKGDMDGPQRDPGALNLEKDQNLSLNFTISFSLLKTFSRLSRLKGLKPPTLKHIFFHLRILGLLAQCGGKSIHSLFHLLSYFILSFEETHSGFHRKIWVVILNLTSGKVLVQGLNSCSYSVCYR